MSGLSSLASSGKKKKENLAIDYDFDILLYAGIKKPSDLMTSKEKRLKSKNKRRSKSYRHQKGGGYGENSIISDFDLEDATTSFGSDSKSLSHSRASRSHRQYDRRSRFENSDAENSSFQANQPSKGKTNLQNIGAITINGQVDSV